MQKDLLPKLDSETLKQLATEQLVEIIIEQGKTIEKLTSRLIELEQEVEKLKFSRDLDSTTSSKPPSGDLLKKTENKLEEQSQQNETAKRKPGGQPGITVPKRENCTLRLKPISHKHFSDTYFP